MKRTQENQLGNFFLQSARANKKRNKREKGKEKKYTFEWKMGERIFIVLGE